MKLSFKWLTVPRSNCTQEVKAVQLYEVRWRASRNTYVLEGDYQEHIEAFTSKVEADDFAAALRNAFTLIRSRKFTTVSVEKG